MQTEALHGHLLPQWQDENGWQSIDPGRHIHATVVFKPVKYQEIVDAVQGGSGLATRIEPLSVDELNQWCAPDPVVVVRFGNYLEGAGLTVHPARAAGLYLDFEGPASAVTKALRCTFAERLVDGRQVYLNREDPQVPAWAVDHVVAIVGLENRSAVRPTHRYPSRNAAPANGGAGFYPEDLKTAYRFPPLTGKGETIGVLEFSNGYNPADLEAFWRAHGITPPSVGFVSVDGTPNDQGVNAVDMECTLDLEWAGALAPEARLVVYEASAGSSDRSFAQSILRALETATVDTVNRPGVLSISYGDAESRFPVRAMQAWDLAVLRAALRGITVLCASGDSGAYGLRGMGQPYPHADAPANVPHILSVGGTTLTLAADLTRKTEVGWSDTNGNGASGGGVSMVFPLPAWQDAASVPMAPNGQPGRGVPDVALVADPDTGYNVVFQGQSTVIGGTSASTPSWAALLTLVNQQRVSAGRGRLGFINPMLYKLGSTAVFHDIVQGNNSIDGITGYSCGPGWDAVTGWGSVNGMALVEHLA